MTLTDDAKAVIALTTRLGSRQRPSLTAKMWHHLALALQDSGHRPSDVFSRSVDLHDLAGVDGDLATRVATLVRDGASATLEVDELRQRGIWTVTIADQDYPRLSSTVLSTTHHPSCSESESATSCEHQGWV